MSYSRYLLTEGASWILIGISMVVSAWPGLLVSESLVIPFAMVGWVCVFGWLAVALRRRGVPLREVSRWMCAGRPAGPGTPPKTMSAAVLLLALARDVVFWAGGTVSFYLACRWMHTPQSLSNGGMTLGMGAAVAVLGLIETFPARNHVLAMDADARTTTRVIRHRAMAFGFPVVATAAQDAAGTPPVFDRTFRSVEHNGKPQ